MTGHGHDPAELEPTPGTTTLLLSSGMDDDETDRCLSLLSGGRPVETVVIRVTYTRSPEALVDEWRERVGDLPARTHVLEVRDRISTPTDSTPSLPDSVSVVRANPNDLTGLAMRIRDVLGDADGPDTRIVVCFDAVTDLLQYHDVRSAYKFLHMLTGQLQDIDAVAHLHLDDDAFDTQTVSRIGSVCTDVSRPEE